MARARLSAIVPNIAGSIGGTTFRNARSGLVIQMRKTVSKSQAWRTNGNLWTNRFLIQSWRTLSNAEKSGWAGLSQTIQFPDRFGVMRYLTPREFFLKAMFRWYYVNKNIYSFADFSNIGIDAGSPFITQVGSSFPALGFPEYDSGTLWVGFQYKTVSYENQPVTFGREFTYMPLLIDEAGLFSLNNIPTAAGLTSVPNQWYAFNIIQYNERFWRYAEQVVYTIMPD